MVTLAGVASVGLSACSIPAALSVARNTYGSSPYLQVHFNATLTSADPALAHFSTALHHLTFQFNEQSLTGLPIKSSMSQVNQDLLVLDGTTRVATILVNKSNVYFNFDFGALGHVPGMTSSAGTLSTLNLLLGQRWIELPFSLVAQYAHSSAGLSLSRSTLASGENSLVSAVVSILARSASPSVTGGFTASGATATLVSSLTTVLKSLGIHSLVTAKVAGTYNVTVAMSGSSATGATVKLVVPMAKYGNATVTLTSTFAHQTLAVNTPGSSLVITPALIKQLSGSGSSLLGGALG